MALGGMTVNEMLERISSRELSEWMAFYGLEPWGSQEDEFRAAMVTSMVANTARDEKKKPKPFVATDFMREMYLNQDLTPSPFPGREGEDATAASGEGPEEGERLMTKAKALFGGMGMLTPGTGRKPTASTEEGTPQEGASAGSAGARRRGMRDRRRTMGLSPLLQDTQDTQDAQDTQDGQVGGEGATVVAKRHSSGEGED